MRPLVVRELARVVAADVHRFAKANKDFRQPLLPENKLRRHRQKNRTLHPRSQMTEAALESYRTLPRIDKAALGRNREEVLKRLEDGFAGTEKLRGTTAT